MANEVRLIEKLRELAGLVPPICQLNEPKEIDLAGKKVTVYCKPFEQFQSTFRQAADRLEELETLRPKGRWESNFYKITCSSCKHSVFLGTKDPVCHKAEKENFKFCPNCGAKMEG